MTGININNKYFSNKATDKAISETCIYLGNGKLPEILKQPRVEVFGAIQLFKLQPSLTPYRAHVHVRYYSIESCPRA